MFWVCFFFTEEVRLFLPNFQLFTGTQKIGNSKTHHQITLVHA